MSKLKIYHGLWKDCGSYTRRGNNYFPLPLKLRKLLQDKAVKFDMDIIEFTYATIPSMHIEVLAIVHPLDFFCRKVGYKIVMDRIKWAQRQAEAGKDINYKSWAYRLV